MEIRIVPAEPDDALQIIRLLHETWLDTYPNAELGITREMIDKSYQNRYSDDSVKRLQERIKKFTQSAEQLRLVAKEEEKVVAMGTMVKSSESNKLSMLYVLPEYQGRGIGTRLWEELKGFIDPSKRTLVEVATYNQKSIDFYKKLGFVDTGRRWTDPDISSGINPPIPEMEMELK